MKKILLFLIIFFPLLISSQNNEQQNKLDNTNSRIDSLKLIQYDVELTVKELKDSFKSLKFKSDTLKSDLLFYKVKEDYYSNALSEQATRFTLIISGILALFAFISFGAFKYEVLKIQKENKRKYSKHQKKFKKHNKKLSKTKKDLINAKGNLYVTIAMLFKKENNYSPAFLYYILGAQNHGKSSNRNNDENHKVTTNNLEHAFKELKKCEADDIDFLKERSSIFSKSFDIISRFENGDTKTLIAEIRVLYNKLTKDDDVA